MTGKQKKALARILVSAGLLAVAAVLDKLGVFRGLAWYCVMPVYLVPYLIVGYPVLRKACVNIAHGQVFDENFLMAIATIGALAIGFLPDAEPEYAEAVFVMLFYQVGELFESIAVGRSRKSIASLMDIRPDSANVERDGEILTVSPEEVTVGEILVIKPGEKIPLDGTVLEGSSSLNTVALTGESVPRDVTVGDDVISGCINQSGLIRVRVTKPFGESTVSRILRLVESAGENKSRSENFITRFARWYTPAVVIGAVVLAMAPPLLSGTMDFATWVFRALEFLVISCPCALVISVPLSFFGGIGGASRKGILIKGSNYMEALAACRTVVFDKTGTLTKGNFRVTDIRPAPGVSREEVLELAAHAEYASDHPVAASLLEAYEAYGETPYGETPCGKTPCGKTPDRSRVTAVEELSGRGIRACVDGETVLAGNGKLLEEAGISYPSGDVPGTVVYLAKNGAYLGQILISDEIKVDAADAVRALRRAGVSRTVMLTGDRRAVAETVAGKLGIDEVRAELLPAGKVEEVERLLATKPQKSTLAFVGDGINDAPVLTRADVGVAMGALGSDAAIEAADVVLMDDKPSGLAEAIRIARKTISIVRENIVLSLAVKFAVLVLCAVVGVPMTLAIFADVGVLVLAVLNAMRALKI